MLRLSAKKQTNVPTMEEEQEKETKPSLSTPKVLHPSDSRCSYANYIYGKWRVLYVLYSWPNLLHPLRRVSK